MLENELSKLRLDYDRYYEKATEYELRTLL